MGRVLDGVWLGRRSYEPVHELQRQLVAERQSGEIGDTVLFVEHEPVITLGRGAKAENLLAPKPLLDERGIDLVATGRGGDVTLHAPGQLVCYPIVDLSPDRCDVRRYVGDLTETMRKLALDFGIDSGPREGLIGLWVDPKRIEKWSGEDVARPVKLGAIGVRLARWVTMHGFALNLTTDLELFQLIVPCGISQYGVGSVQSLTGLTPSVRGCAERALELLADTLGGSVGDFRDRSGWDLDKTKGAIAS